MNVRSRLLSICLSGATQFAGPSNTWMASLPDLATVATVRLNTTTQPRSAPSDLYLSCIQTRRRVIQLFSRRPHQLTNQRNPSRRRRHKWSRRRRMRAAVAARPLPPPLLSAPSISTLELARQVEQSFHSHPLAPTDAILSNVQRSFIDTTPASETCSTNLAIDFGAELLRLTADRLLRELQARFADLTHLDHNMTTAILRYIFEELDIWRRRPERSSSSVPYNLI